MNRAIVIVLLAVALGCGGGTANWETLPSGVKFEDIEPGKGREVKNGDIAVVHYTGWLALGGKVFDSSHSRGKPFEFQLGAGKVIQGWDVGVVGMKVGGKRKLFIPSEMGYGSSGSGGGIPPYADLMFDVELVEVKSSKE